VSRLFKAAEDLCADFDGRLTLLKYFDVMRRALGKPLGLGRAAQPLHGISPSTGEPGICG